VATGGEHVVGGEALAVDEDERIAAVFWDTGGELVVVADLAAEGVEHVLRVGLGEERRVRLKLRSDDEHPTPRVERGLVLVSRAPLDEPAVEPEVREVGFPQGGGGGRGRGFSGREQRLRRLVVLRDQGLTGLLHDRDVPEVLRGSMYHQR